MQQAPETQTAAEATGQRPLLSGRMTGSPAARPILMSAPMVRAILDGRKTQTRRVVKSRWLPVIEESNRVNGYPALSVLAGEIICPYGDVGDLLWVRETFRAHGFCDYGIQYRADLFTRNDPRAAVFGTMHEDRWRPSIHMPRWASRLTLEITGIRVERLQQITAEDAIAEGLEESADGSEWMVKLPKMFSRSPDPTTVYRDLWTAINGPGSWDANPWVFVIEFKRLTP